jgi:hypothetical protein
VHSSPFTNCYSSTWYLLLLLLLSCSLEKGTTYNAYLIFGETHTALVDASHEKFSNLFIATLKQELAAAGRGIDYILVRSVCPYLFVFSLFCMPLELKLLPCCHCHTDTGAGSG